jgi:hypothetical protein
MQGLSPRLIALSARTFALVLALLWAISAWPDPLAPFRDPVARNAVVASVVALVVGLVVRPLSRALHDVLLRPPAWLFTALCALAGAAATVALWRGPMNAQVTSIDSCIYILQGRALAHFDLGIPLAAPRLAHAAKFLFEGADGRLHGVFVPGFPLFLAPFVRWDAFMLAGATLSALMTITHAALARAATRDELAARLSVLLTLPSFARAVEAADLLSHPFVAAMSSASVALALTIRERPTLGRMAALGVCVGWTVSARVLDGMVLAAVVAFALADTLVRRRIPWRFALVAALCALPFVALVPAQQRVATGHVRRPTSVEYADRSDWPRNCLHLGFGKEVGCRVEHPDVKAEFGEDGFTPSDALRAIRHRTSVHGPEVFGVGLLVLVGYALVALRPSFGALVTGLFPVLLTLTYGLFYFGNSTIHGARHIFPAAPFAATVIAQGLTLAARQKAERTREIAGAMLLALVALAVVAHPPRWRAGARVTHDNQWSRLDLRELIERNHITRGLVIFPDVHSYLVALDPWRDGPDLILVHDDKTGEADLRRHHPDLPVWLVQRSGEVLSVRSPAPPPGLQLEFERAWPSFQRPHGPGAAILHTVECCGLPSSGARAWIIFEAKPGDSVDVPFDLATTGEYTLRLDGLVGGDHGTWDTSIDGVPLVRWEGYSPNARFQRGTDSPPRHLAAGRHTFTARCVGKLPESRGTVAVFDALVATPAR